MVPDWIKSTLDRLDEEAKQNPGSTDLSREDWRKVKRIKTRSYSENRGGVRYIYKDLIAVLDDGTCKELRQVGPYKYICRKYELDEAEKQREQLGLKEDAALQSAAFMEFFAQQRGNS